jgi:pleiotropic regulator 1
MFLELRPSIYNGIFSGFFVVAGDNGSMWFWDWKSGHNFQQEQTIVQPGTCYFSALVGW